MMDNMADTIAEHPLRDTDWSDIFTSKRDLLYYDPAVTRAREDLTISKKFMGDVAYWPEFKAVVHEEILKLGREMQPVDQIPGVPGVGTL
jgi:hypothetical protein